MPVPYPFTLDEFFVVDAVQVTVSYLDTDGTYGRVFDLRYRVWALGTDIPGSLVIVHEDTLGPYIDQDLKISYSQWFPTEASRIESNAFWTGREAHGRVPKDTPEVSA
jgi:hypothetical protein